MPLKYYITEYYSTGTRRGLGKELKKHLPCVDTLEECDVFINCKYDEFSQVDLLYDAAYLGKRVINIGSNVSNMPYDNRNKYQIHKAALDKANTQLFYAGHNVTNIKFGIFDSPSQEKHHVEKMSLQYCKDVILWILEQPYRIKSITVTQ